MPMNDDSKYSFIGKYKSCLLSIQDALVIKLLCKRIGFVTMKDRLTENQVQVDKSKGIIIEPSPKAIFNDWGMQRFMKAMDE
ncbi:hypothetical protein VNO78_18947 [Psophocarpus tetragonolobus]|uniref:Uncharacterized protein n=1 Tax=Psophocarpus tetragonolobus TaxID=3891 RepID=A0AAN9XG20_PSOTE